MCRRLLSAGPAVCKRQEETIWRSVLGIACTSALGNADKAERFCFTDRWGYGTPVHPERDELICGNRKSAIVIAAMMGKLNLDARDNQMRRA